MLRDSRSSHVGQSKVDVDGESASAMTSGTLSRFFGGYVRGEIPDPIPNSEVKPSRADGTAREAAWESRTPPELILKGPMHLHGAFFLACGPGWAPAGERGCLQWRQHGQRLRPVSTAEAMPTCLLRLPSAYTRHWRTLLGVDLAWIPDAALKVRWRRG